MSAARRAGDFRVLYPKGVKRMDQVPWPLQEAINQALTVLSWFENYLPEELPPDVLWHDAEFIEQWFARIQERKENERNGERYDEDGESSDMAGNDLASVFKS